ncbi:MAG TPA: SRPBCC family protein [Candidatus Didemnitutus sp.]|nr:SRPBCC family protein [Candidatus Didemnitutus sp.]
MKNENDQPGKFTPPGEIRIIRTLPGPIERAWDYLVDPAKRARWFAGGPIEPRQGGKVELFFHHKEIAPDEQPPERYQKVQDPGFKMPATVLRWEPPHVLSYTFDDESEVTFELTAQGKQVQLLLTHRSRGTDLPFLSGYASGWHTHLAHLIALLEGAPRPPFWPMHLKLKTDYEKTLGVEPK